MSPSFVSTQYLANSLVLPVQQAQAQLATATTEESTGQYANLGLQLGDQSGYELSLKERIQQLQALTAGNSLVSLNLSTAQAALSSIDSSAQTAAQNLATWSAGSASASAQLQSIGQTALQELTASANATSGEAYVFGGINSSEAPFTENSTTAQSAIESAFASTFGCSLTSPAAASVTALQMQTFLATTVAGLFLGDNWSGWSSASSTNTTATIAPGQTVTTSTNTNSAAFQDLAQAYTILAAFGGSSLGSAAQQAVASAATSLISRGQTALTNTQAALGVTQSRVTDANSAMSAQAALIESQLNALDGVDQTATAAKITSLTTQIQMAYELTARLQQLNLAQYLP